MRDSAWYLGLTGLYFLIQAVQRTLLGGALEVDEAEMLLMARHWALGYGPQLPLYNWAQVLVFSVLGPGTAGIAVLKDAVLWLAAVGMWFAMRAAYADRRAAAAAALSLAFLPNVIWEFQRASSHSIAMLAAVTWTLWAWFSVMARPDWRGWLMLGLIMGLGGLSKANYWAVPLGLAVASIGYWPRGRGVLLSVAAAAAIVAVPYAWAVLNPVASLASVHKFYQDAPVVWPWVTGLGLLAGSVLAGLALALIIGGALWPFARARMGAMPVASHILLRAAGLNLLVAALLVVVFGVTKIQARWLVPVLVFAAAAGFGWLGQGLTARAFRAVPVLAGLCAVVTVFGMAQVRLGAGATATVDFAPLAALVTRLDPQRVEGDYFTAGNLALLQPARDIGPVSGDPAGRVLILGGVPNLPTGISVLDAGVLDLPYRGKSDKRFPVEWHMVGP